MTNRRLATSAWDLSDLYPAPDSPQVMADLAQAEQSAKGFAQAHAGTLADLSGAALAAVIAEYERLQEILGRVASYAQLLFAGDSSDPATGRFYQTVNERVTAISSDLIFFSLELNRVDDAVLEAKLADPALARYRPWLRDLRVFRPHQLSDDLEKLTHERDLTASAAWSRLFDETVAAMRINLDGEPLTVSATLNQLSDRDRPVREAAGKAIGKAFGDNIRLFSLITNTLAKDKEIEDTWRHYPRPASFRNRSNMVEDEVVDALATAVRDSYPRLSHRYYQMKAKWLGLPKLQHWDRNAPLPNDDDRLIEWPDAPQESAGCVRRIQSGVGLRGPPLLRPPLDRCAPDAGQVGRRLRASDGAQRASVPAAELSRQDARRDDAGARTRARRASGARRAAGRADVRHAPDPGGNRQRVRRDADVSRRCWTPPPRRSAASCWRRRPRTC